MSPPCRGPSGSVSTSQAGGRPTAFTQAEFNFGCGPFLSQAPEGNASSAASVRPAQEEQLATPPGKVVTVSSRSPRCPRSQSALRNSKTFSPSSAPCSSGEAQPPVPFWVCGLCLSPGHSVPDVWPRSADCCPAHGVWQQIPPFAGRVSARPVT